MREEGERDTMLGEGRMTRNGKYCPHGSKVSRAGDFNVRKVIIPEAPPVPALASPGGAAEGRLPLLTLELPPPPYASSRSSSSSSSGWGRRPLSTFTAG